MLQKCLQNTALYNACNSVNHQFSDDMLGTRILLFRYLRDSKFAGEILAELAPLWSQKKQCQKVSS